MRLPRFRRDRPDRRIDLERELGEVEIPSFPTTVSEVMAMLRQPDVTATQIGKVLEHDPGLHVRVLRTVNSAAYGLRSKVSSVQKAVTLLGNATLETLVLAVAVKDALPRSPASRFDPDSFWRAAARRACVARGLAQRLHRNTVGESFTAALLHDIGVPLLVASKQDRYCELYDRWRSDPEADLSGLELDTFGFDHQNIGAALAERWELPEYLVRAIGGHHSEDDESLEPAVRLVAHVRDAVEGHGADALPAACEKTSDLTADEAVQLIEDACPQAEDFARAIS